MTVPMVGVSYVIQSPETISLSLPAALVQSARPIEAVDPSSLVIRANPGTVTISGGEVACDPASSLTAACILAMSETVLVAGVTTYTLTIELTSEGSWNPVLDADVLLNGLTSHQAEPHGFNNVVVPQLRAVAPPASKAHVAHGGGAVAPATDLPA